MEEKKLKLLYLFQVRYTYNTNDLLFISDRNTIKFIDLAILMLIVSFSIISVYEGNTILILLILVPLLILFFQLFKINFFDVLLIYSDRIQISFPYNETNSRVLQFSEIRKIKYYPPFKNTPNGIKIHLLHATNNKTSYFFYIDQDIYKFAYTLKYIKEKGVLIEFRERDVEIEGFIYGRYDKIPIENNY